MHDRQDLKKIAAGAPDTSGVYLMKDAAGRVIYVGKAKSLKKRLNSYMGRDLDTKTLLMMSHVKNVELRLAPTESLALLLEARLIRQYSPKYNIALPDDKSFPMVKITPEEFPAIWLTRKRENDGATYLGPYTSAGLLREALKIIRRHFPYRTCRKMPEKPCMYYRIGLSPAPCIGKVSKKEYALTIKNICLLLDGRAETLIKRLSVQMKRYAQAHQFEQAAKIRDQIVSLSALGSAHAGSTSAQELMDLKQFLGLVHLPERIEAFDISNIRGQFATGSMVSFYRGIPDKNNYRRFRIKTVHRSDDYRMLAEVVARRYRRLVQENLPLPDLILIDGGRGHLLAAQQELRKLNLNLPLASIAKEEENIYSVSSATPLRFRRDTPGLNLIRRVRDEAHRFAVAYHHLLRRKGLIGR